MPGFLDLIKNSLVLYKKNANDFVILGMIAFIFSVIPDLFSFVPNSLLLLVIMVLFGLVFSAVSAVFSLVNNVIIVEAVHDVNSGKKIHINDLYKNAFKKFWSILFVALITGLVFLASTSLFLIPVVIASVYLVFVMYTLVLENKKGYDALVSSFNYVRGNWWKVFGRVVCLSVISMSFMAFVLFAFIGIYTMMSGSTDFLYVLSGDSDSSFRLIYNLVVKIIISGLITPITTLYIYQIYKYLKNNSTVSSGEEKKTARYWFVGLSIAGIILPIIIAICFFIISIYEHNTTRQNYMMESTRGYSKNYDKNMHGGMKNNSVRINSQNKI